jgi:cytochrome P450
MDTTAHSLAFVIYALARFPSVQASCQREVDAHISASGAFDSLPPYVEAVIKESMRMWPVAGPGSLRQVKTKGGYQLTDDIFLPEGWWVMVSFLLLHRHKGNWGPDADEFKPERWLSKTQETIATQGQGEEGCDPLEMAGPESNIARGSDNPLSSMAAYGGAGTTSVDLSFAPFSAGPRNCVGMNLALLEMRVTLLILISRYHFDLADKTMIDDDHLMETAFTLKPQNGMPVILTLRKVGSDLQID